MVVEITWQTVITVGAVIGALSAIAALILKIVRWYDKQNKQDTDIAEQKHKHDKDIKSVMDTHNEDMGKLRAEIDSALSDQRAEMQLIMFGVLASLKGLKEQGCNGPVTEAVNKLETYLNQKAHN